MVKKKRVPIIFEDDAVIVCEKPAGIRNECGREA